MKKIACSVVFKNGGILECTIQSGYGDANTFAYSFKDNRIRRELIILDTLEGRVGINPEDITSFTLKDYPEEKNATSESTEYR